MEFPDVSSFPCPSPYRGCGGWQFGNRIHHLMRSFHPSIINIAEGSIFRLLGKKILEKFLGPILRAPPSSIPVGQAKGRPFYGQAEGQLCPTWQSYAGLPPKEGACVTGIPFVSPVLHDEEPKPSSSGRRCRRRRRMIAAFRRKAEALKGPDVTLHKKPPVAAPLLKKGLSSARQIS